MEGPFNSAEIVTAINTIWVLVATFLVFFMQLGFGAVRVRTGDRDEDAI